MAAGLPTKPLWIPGTKWTFSMNPGPFNIKEHVLLVIILATSGLYDPFSLSVISISKAFYHKNVNFWGSFLLVETSQLGAETATLTHFILYHTRETWQQFKQSFKGGNQLTDVHNRLMKKSMWWFYAIIVSMMALTLFNSMTYGKEFQLPYWGVLPGYFLPFILILPLGVLNATTGQVHNAMLTLSQLLMGWLYPGNPLRDIACQSYSTATLINSISFLSQFKLAHYMKIPPKSMFITQVLGAFISNAANLGSTWWILTTVENICDIKKLPDGSPWTCPNEHVVFSKSMIWGGVGPSRMFAGHGLYSKIYYSFIGVILTMLVWIIVRMFPEKKWIRLINVPLILISGTGMPLAGAAHYWSWFIVAIIFNLFIYKKYKGWWAKYNYVLSNGLNMGIALMALLASLSLNFEGIYGLKW
ncbi:Oligopeptide transporter [Macleaya cordata]|uniref:Oligopeptide transporter n=1 Tax=Macleaya cordata TaxID=56857 RepID=A0A200QJI8_MACCD|nr:Oligopeptide transporter [Macleaya cordata]